jgi:hypothetical protein
MTRQPAPHELADPPLVTCPIGDILVTARRARSGSDVWVGAEGGGSGSRALLRADGEPCLGPAFSRGSRVKPLGGLFAEWTPTGHQNVRVVSSDGTTRTASSAHGAWVTVVSVRDPHHTWIEYADERGDAYLRRRLDSILAFVGMSWTPIQP